MPKHIIDRLGNYVNQRQRYLVGDCRKESVGGIARNAQKIGTGLFKSAKRPEQERLGIGSLTEKRFGPDGDLRDA